MSGTLASMQDTAAQVAQAFGIPLNLFDAQITAESNWNPNAIGPVNGAGPGQTPVGLGQITPQNFAATGITNPYDPTQSLDAAGALDAQDYSKTGNWVSALESYGTLPENAGSGATLNTAQQALYNIANALSGNSSTGSGTSQVANVATPASTSSTASTPCSGISGFFTFSCYSGILDNGSLIIIALVLLLGGIFVFAGSAISNAAPTIARGKAKFA